MNSSNNPIFTLNQEISKTNFLPFARYLIILTVYQNILAKVTNFCSFSNILNPKSRMNAIIINSKYNKLPIMGCGAQSTTKDGQLSVISPQAMPKYIRKELIGKGTYGQVYRCIELMTNTVYAMKVIKISSKTKQQAIKQVAQLKSEISMLKKLNHPNIVKYQSFDVTSNLEEVEIVMELVKPGTLKEYIEKNGPLSESVCAEVGAKILRALAYLHEQNIIHRDLKCANILITEQMQPKISDFGTAKIVYGKDKDDIAKMSASLKGTPYYMAPQVIKRTGHNQSADIWSFGCTIIEMLSGKAPWTTTGSKFSQIIKYISEGVHPPFPPNITRQCNFFLESCLDPIPSNRLTALQLLKHRFIDKTGIIYESNNKKNLPRKQPQSKPVSKTAIFMDDIEIEDLENVQEQATQQSTVRKYQNAAEKKQSIPNIQNVFPKSEFKTAEPKTEYKKDNQKENNKESKQQGMPQERKTFKRPTQKYLNQMNRLDEIQAQMYEVSISEQDFPKDRYYIKKTLANLKSKKYGKNMSKTSTTVKNTQQNLAMDTSLVEAYNYKDFQLRSNTSTSREQIAINTMISRAERNQYLEQQKLIQKQKEDQKKKWEEQLKQGAQMLKKEMSNRYMLTKI